MRDGLAKDLRTLGGFMLVLGIVSGLALLLFSALFRSWGWLYLADFSKDLGIVVGAVCAVHLAYEMFLADKYFEKFGDQLREEVAKGETNVATCAALGIERIFLTRDVFEQVHSIREWLER